MSLPYEKYRSLIVDDNYISRLLVREILEQIPSVVITGEFDNAVDTLHELHKGETDILFLDVEMPGMSGIDLLRSLQVRPLTILTSVNKGYGSEAFELNVVDYLVKPLHLPRTILAVNRAIELLKKKGTQLKSAEDNHLFIKEYKTIRKIEMSDIYFVESKGDYVKIYMGEKYHVVHSTMRQFEEKLPQSNFIRVHRSFIVAIDKIDYIEENILYVNNIPVPLSGSYRSKFLQKLNML